MARTIQTSRRFSSNILYQCVRNVDVYGRVRYIPLRFGQIVIEIDWRAKDIFEYCRLFFVRDTDDVSVVQCKRCLQLITRRLGWRCLRNHLIDCVGTDFREQFKEQKKQHDEKTLTTQWKGVE